MIENRLTGTCMQRIVIIVMRGHGVPAQLAPRGAEGGRLMATATITCKSALATMIEVVRKAPDAVLTVAPDVDLKDLEDVLVRMHKSASKARKSSAPSKTTLENAALIDKKVVPFVWFRCLQLVCLMLKMLNIKHLLLLQVFLCLV